MLAESPHNVKGLMLLKVCERGHCLVHPAAESLDNQEFSFPCAEHSLPVYLFHF